MTCLICQDMTALNLSFPAKTYGLDRSGDYLSMFSWSVALVPYAIDYSSLVYKVYVI